LTSGVMPRRSIEKMWTGSVVDPGPESIEEMMKSSRLTMKARSQPETTPYDSSGRVTSRRRRHGRA
jgi:hypothetical protein